MRRDCVLRAVLAFAILGVAGAGFYALAIEPASFRVKRHDVALDAPDLKGLRIAVISDLHAGAPHIDAAKIARIVTMTNAAKPDVILLTGDYVIGGVVGGRHMAMEVIAQHLKGLRARQGVYAVIGNHDRWEDADRMTYVLNRAGIRVLENESVLLDGFAVVGIGDDHTQAADPQAALRGVPPGTAAICFTHSPDVFATLPRTCTLTIAGHTHGGQVWLPLLGRPAVSGVSRFGQRYAIGVIREEGRTLFVSSGIGTSGLPLRFGVPPEVSLLEIR
jgi:predicted MPP superfamily phosphohydrolase